MQVRPLPVICGYLLISLDKVQKGLGKQKQTLLRNIKKTRVYTFILLSERPQCLPKIANVLIMFIKEFVSLTRKITATHWPTDKIERSATSQKERTKYQPRVLSWESIASSTQHQGMSPPYQGLIKYNKVYSIPSILLAQPSAMSQSKNHEILSLQNHVAHHLLSDTALGKTY